MSVLDDVRSAREHGELSGGFKAVADEVERVSARVRAGDVRHQG